MRSSQQDISVVYLDHHVSSKGIPSNGGLPPQSRPLGEGSITGALTLCTEVVQYIYSNTLL